VFVNPTEPNTDSSRRYGFDPDSVAIITGAASGIGWATAQRLAREVAHVVVLDMDEQAARAKAEQLGPAHFGVGADVTSESDVQRAVQAVMQRFGRIDILVNNAGIAGQAVPTVDQGVDSFDRVLAVHLKGTFLMSRDVGKVMNASGRGAIVNLGSVVALGGVPQRNSYGAAKAGILALTRSMGCEWARSGIRVNAVAPGYVRTELLSRVEAAGGLDARAIHSRTPMARMGRPDEIAEAIAFLASPAASYITATTLNVDGGWASFGASEATLGELP
jgi:NAD(P)-dependent dehydrogenase (short-subunit alcohol dehydrogenase family)